MEAGQLKGLSELLHRGLSVNVAILSFMASFWGISARVIFFLLCVCRLSKCSLLDGAQLTVLPEKLHCGIVSIVVSPRSTFFFIVARARFFYICVCSLSSSVRLLVCYLL